MRQVGKDLTIVTIGGALYTALEAAEMAKKQWIQLSSS